MTEAEFLDRWANDRPMYEAWGHYVVAAVISHLEARIAPVSADIFLRVPPKARVKGDASFLEKAFYRNKPYENPYEQITDKVGVRFVVLLGSDLRVVEEAITANNDWTPSKDRDYEQERQDHPIQFDYAAVHYILRSNKNIISEGINISVGTTCEVQIKTILQHAYSELTHDTIYKPKVIATPLMKRTAAKSMALIEATNDYFEQVVEQVSRAIGASKALTEQFSDIYRTWIKKEPELTRAEGLILEAYENDVGEDPTGRISRFLTDKNYISGKISEKSGVSLLYRQPSILLVYLLASERPTMTKRQWPLTPDELRPVYVDLGKAFDNY